MDQELQDRFLNSQVINNYSQIYQSFSQALSLTQATGTTKSHNGHCDHCHGAVYRLSLDELLAFDPAAYAGALQSATPFTRRPSVHQYRLCHGSRPGGAEAYTGSYGSGAYNRSNGASTGQEGHSDDEDQFGYGLDDTGQKERYKYVLPKAAEETIALAQDFNYDSSETWSGKFEWTDTVHKINIEVFKNPSFRPKQLEIINCILSGRDTFVVMPTGGGKSLCFQLPVVYDGMTGNNGVTIVVMPLVALIQDQMKRLNALGIPCHALVGELSWSDLQSIFGDISGGNCSACVLFVTPERITASKILFKAFQKLHKQGRLSRFILDEAHCVSVWGNEFRPDYKEMGLLKHEFPEVPVCAFTATATEEVIQDVSTQLRLRSPTIFKSSFNRPNLRYEVINKDKTAGKAIEQLIAVLTTRFAGECGIVYCLSCMEVEKVAEALSKHAKVAPYHAQMQMNMRNMYYKEWMSGNVDIMVATLAFGMGIDKSDVRFVIHFSIPKSIENYFQEAGRAGRDGKPACCIIFYLFHDSQRLLSLVERNTTSNGDNHQTNRQKILSVLEYCESGFLCRRKVLLQYFGETLQQNCHVPCDSCSSDQPKRFLPRNCQKEALYICESILYSRKTSTKPGDFTLVTLHKVLLERPTQNHHLSGYLKRMEFSSEAAMLLLKYMIIYQLLIERVVSVTAKNFYSYYIRVNPQYRSYLHYMASLRFPIEPPIQSKRPIQESQGAAKKARTSKLAAKKTTVKKNRH